MQCLEGAPAPAGLDGGFEWRFCFSMFFLVVFMFFFYWCHFFKSKSKYLSCFCRGSEGGFLGFLCIFFLGRNGVLAGFG